MTESDEPIAEPNVMWNEPLGVALTAAVQRGDAEELARILKAEPDLARARVVKTGEAAASRTLLHLFADWPGHRRNPREIVNVLRDAGTDLNAPVLEGHAPETALHWAACNDDLELVEALLDAGADIEAPGSAFGGGAPISAAVNCGATRAAEFLLARGAQTNLYQAAALGLVDRVRTLLAVRPNKEQVTSAFLAACGAGQRQTAEMMLDAGADINGRGWGNESAVDAARGSGAEDLAGWLQAQGGRPAPRRPPPH